MSVERRGKKWRVRWREGGRARSRTFDRRDDAVLFDADRTRRKQLGLLAVTVAAEQTLDTYFEDSWKPHARARLSERTYEDYLYLYRSLVKPILGGYRLEEITVEALRNWQATVVRSWGAATVEHSNRLLSSMLQEAVVNGWLSQNPARVVKSPKIDHREIPPLPSPIVTEKLREAARELARWPELGERDALLISLVAYGGLRPGEALGLRWGDIRANTILIQRVLVKAGFRPTKTRQRRSVKLLAALHTDLVRARTLLGREPKLDEQVLKGRGRELLSFHAYQSWEQRAFRRACKKVGVGLIVLYDLRHAFASLLLHEGRSVIYVANQLGHDPRLTLDTYGHVIAELEDEPQLSADEAIKRARETFKVKSGQLSLPGLGPGEDETTQPTEA
jgi:integrase